MRRFKLILLLIFSVSTLSCQTTPDLATLFSHDSGEKITPTEVYYLAQSISDSLIIENNLYNKYQHNYLSRSTKLSNNFLRACYLLEEFNQIYRSGINQQTIKNLFDYARSKESLMEPHHVYALLKLIKTSLENRGHYHPYQGTPSPKEPADVYFKLREISFHLQQIAQARSAFSWHKPEKVFQDNYFYIYQPLYLLAQEAQLTPEVFNPPLKSNLNIVPADVFRTQVQVYLELSRYLKSLDPNYEVIQFEVPQENTSITPGDVFDLTEIIVSEFYGVLPEKYKQTDKEKLSIFYNWRHEKKKIVPGDVLQLVQYNLNLIHQINVQRNR